MSKIRVIPHNKNPSITLTHLPQCNLWVFSRPNKPSCLFMTTYSSSIYTKAVVSFEWHEDDENYHSKPYFYTCYHCIHGSMISRNGMRGYFSMKRGPTVFFSYATKKWKDVHNHCYEDELMHPGLFKGLLVLDKTHSAVQTIQKACRRWSYKQNLKKLLFFHQGTGLASDCIYVISLQLQVVSV